MCGTKYRSWQDRSFGMEPVFIVFRVPPHGMDVIGIVPGIVVFHSSAHDGFDIIHCFGYRFSQQTAAVFRHHHIVFNANPPE